jgi:hypothetical protein
MGDPRRGSGHRLKSVPLKQKLDVVQVGVPSPDEREVWVRVPPVSSESWRPEGRRYVGSSSMDRAPYVPGRMFPSSSFWKERRCDVENVKSLEGQVLKVKDVLMVLIPLADGGSELVHCSRGVSEVQGEFLKIVIPEWIAGMLRIEEGDLVCVHNTDGKFHINASHPRLVN